MTQIIKTLTILLLYSFSLNAQVEEILGRVLETETEFPVPYATIQFKNNCNGVIANIDGDFRIPYYYKQVKDTLLISCIGYENKLVPLTTLNDKEINIISLKPKLELLDQVVIKSSTKKNELPPEVIVQKAIVSIPKNYPFKPFSKIGYYRDYQILNGRYYNLNEAIIESFDAGFGSDVIMDSYNDTAIYKYLENEEFERDSTLTQEYDGNAKYVKNTLLSGQGGNELGILNIHDPIRNFDQLCFSFVYVFKKKFIDNHEFIKMKTVYLNDDPLYEISFKAKDKLTGTSHEAKGRIYIDKETYAINKFVYQVYERYNPDPLFQVNIEYIKKGAKMFLNYITFNNRFTIDDKLFFDVNKVEFDASENSFYVSFNSDIDIKSVDKRDFRFKYEKKKLLVEDYEIVSERLIKVKIADWSVPTDIESMKDFEYRVKKINDSNGRKLYEKEKVIAYQFREFFVQEIFSKRKKPRALKFMNRVRPLSESDINNDESKSRYWLNSPLRTIK